MKKKYLLLAAAGMLAISLAGCGTQPASIADDAAAVTEPAPADEVAEEVTEEGPASTTAKFGQAFTYPDGLAITVSEPRDFVPTEYAAGVDNPVNIVLDVTITNNSAENFETLAFAELTSGGRAGSTIIDIGNPALPDGGMGGTGTTLLPGQSITWTEAWSVLDGADLTYIVSPSTFAYEDAIFTR
jgi:hypothetical protein